MTTFLVILGSIGIIVIMFFIFKWINYRKIKRLESENRALNSQNAGLEEKVEQMNRERVASNKHLQRLKRSRKETEKLKQKIDKAHTDKEILELMDYIDNDNNNVVRG